MSMEPNKFNYLKYFVNKQVEDLRREKNDKEEFNKTYMLSMHESLCNALAIYETIQNIIIRDKL